ncbi:hypothetical protein CVN68_07740 [Sphingomonas psychrotolerans]|uniref:Uncharacterized protein n=1 Tax=Sphingomonas psychrotolerans TaxID=1327635 RepID=A0A2K8MH49_9SPHN|nr:hypothetical protein CVN68_07740 [Sphingomonas psychrotolerans]
MKPALRQRRAISLTRGLPAPRRARVAGSRAQAAAALTVSRSRGAVDGLLARALIAECITVGRLLAEGSTLPV